MRSLAVLLVLCGTALACVLGRPVPICERFWNGDAVVLAEVVDIQVQKVRLPNGIEIPKSRHVTLQIVDVFRGEAPTEVTVSDRGSDCGMNFPTMGRYLTWLTRKKDGGWKAYSDYGPDTEREMNLAYAEAMKHPPATGRIFGTLGIADPLVINMTGPPSMKKPLPSSRLVAEGAGGRFEVRPQKNGNYEFKEIPPGRYRISAEDLPAKLSADPSDEFELRAGGCKEVDLRADVSTSISGHVSYRGRTPGIATISLLPAEEASGQYRPNPDIYLEEDGNFRFAHVRRGKWILAFQFEDAPSIHTPYRQLFYPGVESRSAATVLSPAEAEQIGPLEFDVGEELPQRELVVNLRWIDGSPAPNARVLLRDLKDAIGIVGEEPLTDTSGRATLHGFVGRGYKVDTYPECSDGTRRDASATTPASVVASTVSIVLPEPKCDLVAPKSAVFDDD